MQNYITPNFVFAEMIPDHASGSRVWSTDGREYIDFAGGIAVNALGHCHPVLQEALRTQAEKLWHISNLYTTEPTQHLAEKLVRHTFSERVFFCNSGAEANEAALKLARKYARDHYGIDKYEIVACLNGFHGRTLFTVSVGGQEKYSADFAPLPAGIHHIPFNDVAALRSAVNDKTCAVIIEPIQGESGVLPATHEFLQVAREVCDAHQAQLIFDEVQTGMGRTGKLFAYQHYGIVPDILTNAKALGCGFPIGVMMTTENVAASLTPGSHGSTFGGNPLACAVANAAFDLINQPDVLEHVKQQGMAFQAALSEINQGVFEHIRGQGLLIGAVLNEPYQSGDIVKLALNEGLMILSAGSRVVRFAPSLLLNDIDLMEGMLRLQRALHTLKRQNQ